MKITDFKGLFKRSIATIEAIENPFDDYYLIRLKPASGTKWLAGEHAIFKLPEAKVEGKKYRAFSIASVTEEGHILLGTRTGKQVSSYKKALISSKKGAKVKIMGPFGWFKLQDNTSPIVMAAAGVGITPMRALLKDLEKDTSRPISLVYASDDNYLFEEELEAMAEANPQVTLIKTSQAEETSQALGTLVEKFGHGAWYYVSGSQGFIEAMKQIVTKAGVSGKRFINDPFLGY